MNRRSQTLGVVVSGLEYYGPSRTLIGVEQEANAQGYALLLDLLHNPMEADVDSVLNLLTARRVDGIVWAVHEIGCNRAWVAAERLAKLPPMVFLTMEPCEGITVVNTDNFQGAQLATQHLLEQGRRRIGLITGPLTWWEARERQRGWRQSLLDAGCPADDSLSYEGDWTPVSGEEGFARLLQDTPDLDAVFAANDHMALGVLRAAHRLGKRIPEDLAVVGYDNMPEAAYFWPALTSIRQRLSEVGYLAIRTLHDRIEAKLENHAATAMEVHTLNPELIVRESSLG